MDNIEEVIMSSIEEQFIADNAKYKIGDYVHSFIGDKVIVGRVENIVIGYCSQEEEDKILYRIDDGFGGKILIDEMLLAPAYNVSENVHYLPSIEF